MKKKTYSQHIMNRALELILDGKSISEVAKEMKIPRGTVATWQRKSKEVDKILADEFGKKEEDKDSFDFSVGGASYPIQEEDHQDDSPRYIFHPGWQTNPSALIETVAKDKKRKKRKKRKYTKEFKENTLDVLFLKNGLNVQKTAKELNIPVGTLRTWKTMRLARYSRTIGKEKMKNYLYTYEFNQAKGQRRPEQETAQAAPSGVGLPPYLTNSLVAFFVWVAVLTYFILK